MVSLALQIIAFLSVFGFFTYACIFADPDTSALGRFCTEDIPSFLYRCIERICGQKILARLSKLADRGLQIFYLFVVLGSWSVVFAWGYPAIERSQYIRTWHQYAGYVVFVCALASWHKACRVGPGNVTARTIPLFDHYEYDDIIYTNRICKTLKIRKIARSKYDRCTDRHVPRFDHFCGWINQSVGERNYRWFLLFLTTHVFMCLYGTWAMATVLWGQVLEKDLLNATFFNGMTGAEVEADYIIIFHYIFSRNMPICAVLLLMSVMGVMLGAFLGFHICITSFNMTTNEQFKWKRVKQWHKKERKRYEKALKEGNVAAKSNPGMMAKQVSSDVDVGCTGPVAGGAKPDVIAEDDIIDPGPMPRYIYNKGFVANWKEVLFPLSFREEAIRRYVASARDRPDGVGGNNLPDSGVSSKPKNI
ncbi:hypothetical protein ACHAXT_001052 [Thalassiosira profunda]